MKMPRKCCYNCEHKSTKFEKVYFASDGSLRNIRADTKVEFSCPVQRIPLYDIFEPVNCLYFSSR